MTGDHDHHTSLGQRRPPDVQRWESNVPADVPYRVSDLERDEAMSALGDAYAEGRLDYEQFELRLEAATSAVFESDLHPLFADLPRSRAMQAPVASAPNRNTPTRPPGRPRPSVGALFLLALAVVTHAWLLIPLAFVLGPPWVGTGHIPSETSPGSPAAVGPAVFAETMMFTASWGSSVTCTRSRSRTEIRPVVAIVDHSQVSSPDQ